MNVLDGASAGEILGGTWATDERSTGSIGGTGTLGGLWCSWSLDDGADLEDSRPYALDVRVVAASDVPADLAQEVSSARCDAWYDAMVCRRGEITAGLWIVASTSGTTAEPDAALLKETIDAVASRASGFEAPVRSAATEAWWALLPCETLGERMRLAEILASDFVTGWWEGNLGDQLEYRHTDAEGVERICQWYPSNSEAASQGITTITVWPGGGWDADRLLADGDETTLSGGQRASVSADGLSASATDGINAVHARVEVTGDALATLERFFAVASAG